MASVWIVAEQAASVSAINLFCGAGGLSYGLKRAGIKVVAGVDLDPACRYPFEQNVGASFWEQDVGDLAGSDLEAAWPSGDVRLLAGCAPCQPFSPYRRGADTSGEKQWPLLSVFGRLIEESRPELVTMENVPRLGSSEVFDEFVGTLCASGYFISWKSCACAEFGLPQQRRRLVLLASLLGPIEVPEGSVTKHRTVRDTISKLPSLRSGGVDPKDPLHCCRSLSELNLERIRASTPGGTWEDWPARLRLACHRKDSGSSFRNVYGRMQWDEPAPTITTLAHNFGTGRFGHPDQDRPISLREAAMLQGFPAGYRFVAKGETVHFSHLGRLIGNAVPPPIGTAVGRAMLDHLAHGVRIAVG